MRSILAITAILLSQLGIAQNAERIFFSNNCLIGAIKNGDSITYYQCHVEDATQQMVTVSGQTITGKAQAYTITEKFVIAKLDSNYRVTYYTSDINIFPNKKFSGLKIREKPDWHFKYEGSFPLSILGAKALMGIENKGREAMEYDYPITKYTKNQVIIKHKKNFKQLVIEGPFVLSKLILK